MVPDFGTKVGTAVGQGYPSRAPAPFKADGDELAKGRRCFGKYGAKHGPAERAGRRETWFLQRVLRYDEQVAQEGAVYGRAGQGKVSPPR